MNLCVSRINNNVSFGMAKFSDKGLRFARSCSDVFERFGDEQKTYLNPEFIRKLRPLEEAPFERYIKMMIPISSEEANPNDTREVAQIIISHGTTDNQTTNANFVKQLLRGRGFIDVANDRTRKELSSAVLKVFEKNWDNPQLSKKQTLALLETAKYAMDDKQYAVALAVIQKSDLK